MKLEKAIAKHLELLKRGAYVTDVEIGYMEIGKAFLRGIGVPIFPSDRVQRSFAASEMKSTATRAVSKVDRPHGFVYLMRNNRNQHVKIGWSTNPVVRESTLQSEEPDVELIARAPGTRELEADLHKKFDLYRVRGEWFALSEMAVVALMSEVFRAV